MPEKEKLKRSRSRSPSPISRKRHRTDGSVFTDSPSTSPIHTSSPPLYGSSPVKPRFLPVAKKVDTGAKTPALTPPSIPKPPAKTKQVVVVSAPAKPNPDYHLEQQYQLLMSGLGSSVHNPTPAHPPLPPPIVTPVETTTTKPTVAVRPSPVKPTIKIKALGPEFGKTDHDIFHFASTTEKKYHGVWGSRDLPTVKSWVNSALMSIRRNDDFVVRSKAGDKPGSRVYLVSMGGEKVGYLSGSAIKRGTAPEAQYIEVYVSKNDFVVSAFPSDPSTWS